MRARGTILRKYEMFGWRLVFDSNHCFLLLLFDRNVYELGSSSIL